MLRAAVSLVTITIFACLSGCANQAAFTSLGEPTPPHFVESDKHLSVIIDCFMFSNVEGDETRFDPAQNEQLCTLLSESVTSTFQQLNISNYEIIALTGGLQAGPNKYLKSTESESPLYPPFYYAAKKLSPSEQTLYSLVADALSVNITRTDQRKRYINSLKEVSYSQFEQLALPENSYTLFVLVEGVSVPASKTAAEAIGTSLLTLGLFSRFSVSTGATYGVMLDSRGTPVWGDVVVASFLEKPERVHRLIEMLFRYLPDNPCEQKKTCVTWKIDKS